MVELLLHVFVVVPLENMECVLVLPYEWRKIISLAWISRVNKIVFCYISTKKLRTTLQHI
jgi:hypothetical protein